MRPTAGELRIGAAPITGPGAERGLVFQDPNLFPWLTVRGNIQAGLVARGLLHRRRREVEEFMALVGLEAFADAYPHQLSGGMAQRAALARALINHPKVLLLDEPLGSLDAFTRMRMQDEVLRLWQARGTTMLLVTHDIDEAIYMSDRIFLLTPRPAAWSAFWRSRWRGRGTATAPVSCGCGRRSWKCSISLATPRSRAKQTLVTKGKQDSADRETASERERGGPARNPSSPLKGPDMDNSIGAYGRACVKVRLSNPRPRPFLFGDGVRALPGTVEVDALVSTGTAMTSVQPELIGFPLGLPHVREIPRRSGGGRRGPPESRLTRSIWRSAACASPPWR